MLFHITPQRTSLPFIKARKNTNTQMPKRYLTIAVGMALTCFTPVSYTHLTLPTTPYV